MPANVSLARLAEYRARAEPVIIEGWPGVPQWSLDRLVEVCGDVTVTMVRPRPASHAVSIDRWRR